MDPPVDEKRRMNVQALLDLFVQRANQPAGSELENFLREIGIGYRSLDMRNMTLIWNFKGEKAYFEEPYMYGQDMSNHEGVILKTLNLLPKKFFSSIPLKQLFLWGKSHYGDVGFCSPNGERVDLSYTSRGEPFLGLAHILLHEIGHSAERTFPPMRKVHLPQEYYTQRSDSLASGDCHDGSYTDLLPFFALFPKTTIESYLSAIREEKYFKDVERFREAISTGPKIEEARTELVKTILETEEKRGFLKRRIWGEEATQRYEKELEFYQKMVSDRTPARITN